MSPSRDYGLYENYQDYQLNQELWDRTTENSDYFDGLEPHEQRELYQQFEQTIYDGDYDGMKDLLEELGIEWDEYDWDDWRDLYNAAG